MSHRRFLQLYFFLVINHKLFVRESWPLHPPSIVRALPEHFKWLRIVLLERQIEFEVTNYPMLINILNHDNGRLCVRLLVVTTLRNRIDLLVRTMSSNSLFLISGWYGGELAAVLLQYNFNSSILVMARVQYRYHSMLYNAQTL